LTRFLHANRYPLRSKALWYSFLSDFYRKDNHGNACLGISLGSNAA
jgi:hypothetical protein